MKRKVLEDQYMQSVLNLHQLILYRNILQDSVVKGMLEVLNLLQSESPVPRKEMEEAYFVMLHDLFKETEDLNLSGDVFKKYILKLIFEDENAFSLACERAGQGVNENLLRLAAHDLEILFSLYNVDWKPIHKQFGMGDILANIQINKQETKVSQNHFCMKLEHLGQILSNNDFLLEKLKSIAGFYHQYGCGKLARYLAFRWDNGLVGIDNPDPITFDDLVGYAYQKETLIANTQSFVHGKPANNVLLYGEKGCGKSSSVKALLNRFASEGLRIIELTKGQLKDFNRVIQSIRGRCHRFIIFIDDLSFEDFEVDYKYIKSSFEGTLEATADNVLIYVTSNRRHLIKENWSDRQSTSEEVHISDSHQEKLSFADRFGITISYFSPDQDQYLQIVDKLACEKGIDIPLVELHRQAIRWEIGHHGRSGRTAHQFIAFITGQ
jgi:predicted AAA+ superfamily ATPase